MTTPEAIRTQILSLEAIAKLSVMPECFCRASMISDS